MTNSDKNSEAAKKFLPDDFDGVVLLESTRDQQNVDNSLFFSGEGRKHFEEVTGITLPETFNEDYDAPENQKLREQINNMDSEKYKILAQEFMRTTSTLAAIFGCSACLQIHCWSRTAPPSSLTDEKLKMLEEAGHSTETHRHVEQSITVGVSLDNSAPFGVLKSAEKAISELAVNCHQKLAAVALMQLLGLSKNATELKVSEKPKDGETDKGDALSLLKMLMGSVKGNGLSPSGGPSDVSLN